MKHAVAFVCVIACTHITVSLPSNGFTPPDSVDASFLSEPKKTIDKVIDVGVQIVENISQSWNAATTPVMKQANLFSLLAPSKDSNNATQNSEPPASDSTSESNTTGLASLFSMFTPSEDTNKEPLNTTPPALATPSVSAPENDTTGLTSPPSILSGPKETLSMLSTNIQISHATAAITETLKDGENNAANNTTTTTTTTTTSTTSTTSTPIIRTISPAPPPTTTRTTTPSPSTTTTTISTTTSTCPPPTTTTNAPSPSTTTSTLRTTSTSASLNSRSNSSTTKFDSKKKNPFEREGRNRNSSIWSHGRRAYLEDDNPGNLQGQVAAGKASTSLEETVRQVASVMGGGGLLAIVKFLQILWNKRRRRQDKEEDDDSVSSRRRRQRGRSRSRSRSRNSSALSDLSHSVLPDLKIESKLDDVET